MTRFIFLLTCLLAIAFTPVAHAQRTDAIAAVVNGDIITYTDVYDRMDLIIKSSKIPSSKKFKEHLLPQVLTGLITEQIQGQEAQRIGLKVSAEELTDGFSQLAAQNKFKPQEFKDVLKKQKINEETVEAQIRSQLAWGKVIQREIRPRINLTDSDINSEIERLKTQEGQDQYFIAEIFLPVNESSTEAQVKKAADDISRQLSKNPSKFQNAARQFSQSATAANGGVIGWITLDQINPNIVKTIQNTPLKSISQPIRDDDGYTILFINDKRKVHIEDQKSKEITRVKIAMLDLPDDQEDRKDIREDAQILVRDVKGCLDINEQVLKRDYATLREIDEPTSNLPVGLRDAIDGVHIGSAGKIIERDNKIMIPVVCGRDGGTGNAALEREIEMRLGTQRLDVLQKRYLRDLISNAYIERRI